MYSSIIRRKPYNFAERQAPLSESLTPAHHNASLSDPQNEPTINIYSSVLQDPSQNQNPNTTIKRQIIHPRQNKTQTIEQTLITNIDSLLTYQATQNKSAIHLLV